MNEQTKKAGWSPRFLYVGAYTSGGAEGIYSLAFDPQTGNVKIASVLGDCVNPSYLLLRGERLYAANEVETCGAVTSCAVDRETGMLKQLGRVETAGQGTCHVAASGDGRFLYAAHYGSGGLACFPILEDGRAGEACCAVEHHGRSVNAARQERPHAHSVNPDPSGGYLIAADLGIDRLMIYKRDPRTGALEANPAQPFVETPPGEGPRHLAFHPNGRAAYLTTELGNHVLVYDYDGRNGTLTQRQTLPLLPSDFRGESFAAHLSLTPDASALMVSNRGWDRISVFGVAADGGLEPRGDFSACGAWPRHFSLSPDGAFIAVACQNAGRVAICALTQGRKPEKIAEITLPSPVCVVWQ